MKKQICVIGLGQFGNYLARTLAQLNCDVLAIDNDETAVAAIRDEVQQAVITDVRKPQSLASVVSSDIDEAIVCFSENMEASILCVLHLKAIGVRKIRAKAAGRDHATILNALGADEIIFPEQETAKRMAQRIVNPDLLDYLPLSEEYRVVETQIPEIFVNHTLAELDLRKKYRILVIAIKTPGDNRITFMPTADTPLRQADTLVVMGKCTDIEKLQEAK
ncbi:MAG: TrkA family potassium uptake protein [Phycisphaerales bacterium]|nr:TrkA family potassium uptake protein [Phycisphaerales bacterium]